MSEKMSIHWYAMKEMAKGLRDMDPEHFYVISCALSELANLDEDEALRRYGHRLISAIYTKDGKDSRPKG